MAEYIDREKLLAEIDKLKLSPWFNRGKNVKADYQHCMYLERKEGVEVVVDLCIKGESIADVVPDIHAKWESDKLFGECAYVCTFCHTIWTSSEIDNMHYCPTCGAKMDGE